MKEAGIYGLAHVGVFVKDLNISKKFYQEKLGFSVAHENTLETDNGTIKVVFMQLGDLTIECIELPIYDAWRKDGKVDHIAMRVSDIDSVVESLKNKGIEFEGEVYTAEHFWGAGSRWITFRGPDQEHLELTELL